MPRRNMYNPRNENKEPDKPMNAESSSRVQNVDHQEIAKFEAVASRWWDLEGEFKPLHRINPLRLNYIMQRAGGILTSRCSTWAAAAAFWRKAWRAKAPRSPADMGAEPLQVARLHALESGMNVTYVQETVESHAQANPQRYDVVTCMEMLEHVPDPASVVRACAQLVKPGGHVFFSTINRNTKAWLMAVIGAEYVLKMVPQGTHDHKVHSPFRTDRLGRRHAAARKAHDRPALQPDHRSFQAWTQR